MPDNAYAAIQFYVAFLLRQFLQRARLGRARIEWRCIFGPTGRERVFVPDIAYVSFDRIPPGDARELRYPHTAPDRAVEVLSPDQSLNRFLGKITFYLLHGVRLVWVIDPREETVVVLAPGQDARVLRSGAVLDGGEVLPGFSVPVAEIVAQLHEG